MRINVPVLLVSRESTVQLMWMSVAHTRARTERHVRTQRVAQFFPRVILRTESAVVLRAWFSVATFVLFLAVMGRF